MTETIVDILEIDKNIQKMFLDQWNELEADKKRLEDLEQSCLSLSSSPKYRIELEKNISELKTKIDLVENKRNLQFYIAETAELLERYKQILKTPQKLSFLGKSIENSKEKKDVIKTYLKIAQKYYPPLLNRKNTSFLDKKFQFTCENCHSNSPSKNEFILTDSAYICTECGAEQELIHHTTSYKDAERVNTANKYVYDRKVHFRDCLYQYQAKQNCTIDSRIYTDLEKAFADHHLLVGDQTTPKNERFSKITKEHVLLFLKELARNHPEYAKHYENVILIHYNMTGKKPDDISHLEDKLLDDFDLLVETYDRYAKNRVERVNFISSHYVLYQLLRRHKHPCRKEDFVILKTTDRIAFHDRIFGELCGIIGWSFTPLI